MKGLGFMGKQIRPAGSTGVFVLVNAVLLLWTAPTSAQGVFGTPGAGGGGPSIGGVGAGVVFDHLQTYGPAFAVGVALCMVIGMLQFFASPNSIRREIVRAEKATPSN